MRKWLVTAAFLGGLFLLTARAEAPAPPAAGAGPITGKITAAELAKIKNGEVILRSATSEESKSGKGYAVGLFKAAPAQIWATILDYDKYAEFMPRVSSCKRTLYQGNKVDADFVLDMGLAKVRYSINHTINMEKNFLSWVLDATKPKDYITKTIGYWQLEPIPEGCGGSPCTLVEYNVEVDIDVPVIGFLLRGLVKKMTHDDLPNVIQTLKKRTESGNTWKK